MKAKRQAVADRTLSIRVPGSLLERIEAIVPPMSEDPTVIATKGGSAGVGVSAVVRLALLEGLTVLEKRYAPRSK